MSIVLLDTFFKIWDSELSQINQFVSALSPMKQRIYELREGKELKSPSSLRFH